MTTDIKPIETRYAGCRFRSRLEARWAVFFDTVGVPWAYETQGFELPSGPYLPDFRLWGDLPGMPGGWFEVKGMHPTDQEQRLAQELADATDWTVWIAYGDIPRDRVNGNALFAFRSGEEARLIPHTWMPDGLRRSNTPTIEEHDEALESAFAVARSARFEHGETPIRRPAS